MKIEFSQLLQYKIVFFSVKSWIPRLNKIRLHLMMLGKFIFEGHKISNPLFNYWDRKGLGPILPCQLDVGKLVNLIKIVIISQGPPTSCCITMIRIGPPKATNRCHRLSLISQADWCNNCGSIHRSIKFSSCVDNMPRQIHS